MVFGDDGAQPKCSWSEKGLDMVLEGRQRTWLWQFWVLDGVALVLVSGSLPLVPLTLPQDCACYPVLMELMDLLALRLCPSLHSP